MNNMKLSNFRDDLHLLQKRKLNDMKTNSK